MKNGLIGIVVGILISIVCVGSLLAPAIQDVTTTHTTFENTGLYYVTDSDESLTYEYLGDTDWRVNGETLDYTVNGASNIIVANDIFVRNNGQVRGSISTAWASAELTVSDGTVTGTAVLLSDSSTVEIDWDCSEVFYGAVNGETDYLMSSSLISTYCLEDSAMYGAGISYVTSSATAPFEVIVEGDTATVTSLISSVEISNISVNRTAVDGYEGLYVFESVTFDTTFNDETRTQTYNQIIVPSSVTAELSEHLSDSEISLFNVILVVTILSILVYAAMYIVRRD